jgi:hypothetical protein
MVVTITIGDIFTPGSRPVIGSRLWRTSTCSLQLLIEAGEDRFHDSIRVKIENYHEEELWENCDAEDLEKSSHTREPPTALEEIYVQVAREAFNPNGSDYYEAFGCGFNKSFQSFPQEVRQAIEAKLEGSPVDPMHPYILSKTT